MSATATIAPDPMAPARYRVVSRIEELDDTVTVGLEPLDDRLAAHTCGQFHMIWVFGVGEVPVSISSAPDDRGPILHTVRAVGPVTAAIARLAPGDVVGLRGPYGRGWPLDGAGEGRDLALVAGGIGLAPIRPLVRQVLARRDRHGRVAVFIGGRSPEALLYRPEIERWRSHLDLDVEVTVDRAGPGWHGDVGVVTQLLRRLPLDWAGAAAFVCGPEVMMRFAARSLAECGVSESRIHLSLERNMKCAVAQCGHCQLGPVLVCREGPVFDYHRAGPWLATSER